MATKVTITGSGHSTYCYVTINGTTYTEAASDITVAAGATIVFSGYGSSGYVTIDGDTVASGGSGARTYTWTVPAGISQISIAMAHSTSFVSRYGRITVTTTVVSHLTLIDGVGRDVVAGRCMVDGVGYSIQHGRTLIDGVGYNIGREGIFDWSLYLEHIEWGNADRMTTVSETEIYMSVISTGSNYAGTEFQLYQQGKPYLLPEGSVVSATFVGSGGSAIETRIRFCTDINDSDGTQLEKLTSSGTYTVTTPCYMTFLCQTANNRNGTATLSITDLTIDGVRAWAK